MCIKHAHRLSNYTWEDKEQKERDSRNSPKEWDEQRFQAVAQSYKDPMRSSMILPTECSWFSKIRPFRSRHMFHIIQWGIKFQILEDFRPHQLCQPAKKSLTVSGKTQETPYAQRTKFHNSLATLQWSNKWLTDSPLFLHMQHQPAITKPLLMRLSQVKIQPQAAVQTKKITLWGAFTFQTLFQANSEAVDAWRAR